MERRNKTEQFIAAVEEFERRRNLPGMEVRVTGKVTELVCNGVSFGTRTQLRKGMLRIILPYVKQDVTAQGICKGV